ncbi:MAG TPA: sigma-70 family RNA polymerase sigma factor [Puia sp.]|nr:sigma-70 family RNA polymerase sigma factor [Puia sp.]
MIVCQTEGLVAQIVFKMVSQTEDRKDIAQDVYLKAYQGLARFRFSAKLSTWIGQIAYNTCLSYLERKKLVLPGDGQEGEEPEETSRAFSGGAFPGVSHDNVTESTLYQRELSAILRTALQELSPIYRTLITLYHQEELSYEEIRQITGLPEGTVKNYLFRARRALKDHLMDTYKKEGL